MVVREESEADPVETQYFKNPDHEEILTTRVRFYIAQIELLPSHRKWFTEPAKKVLHKQLTRLVLLEIEWEKFTRQIHEDYESNRRMTGDREKAANQIDRLQKSLGLNANTMSKIPDGILKTSDELMDEAMTKFEAFAEQHG